MYATSVGVCVVGAGRLCDPIVNAKAPVEGLYVDAVGVKLLVGEAPTLTVTVSSRLIIPFLVAEANVCEYCCVEEDALPTFTVNVFSVTAVILNHLRTNGSLSLG